jgi:hypothetical protein
MSSACDAKPKEYQTCPKSDGSSMSAVVVLFHDHVTFVKTMIKVLRKFLFASIYSVKSLEIVIKDTQMNF